MLPKRAQRPNFKREVECCEMRLQKWMGVAMPTLVACIKGFTLVVLDVLTAGAPMVHSVRILYF